MSKDVTSKGTSVKTAEFKESAAAVAVKKGGVAPKTNLPSAKGVVKKEKVLIPDIIRGRMPIAVVAMVRYGDQKDGDVRSLAKLFGTTVGKITDIKKNSTFTYLPATFRPTAQQKADGIAWLQRHVGYKNGDVDKLINELEKTKEATVAEAAEYEAIRAKAKGQVSKTKDGTIADGGGGNRVKKVAVKTTESVKKLTAKDLL